LLEKNCPPTNHFGGRFVFPGKRHNLLAVAGLQRGPLQRKRHDLHCDRRFPQTIKSPWNRFNATSSLGLIGAGGICVAIAPVEAGNRLTNLIAIT